MCGVHGIAGDARSTALPGRSCCCSPRYYGNCRGRRDIIESSLYVVCVFFRTPDRHTQKIRYRTLLLLCVVVGRRWYRVKSSAMWEQPGFGGKTRLWEASVKQPSALQTAALPPGIDCKNLAPPRFPSKPVYFWGSVSKVISYCLTITKS